MSSARTFDKGVSAAAPSQPLPPFAGEHEELRASIRGFIARELRPHATEWEDARWFPDEVFTTLAGNGFLGLKYPEAYGGEGGDHLHDAIFTEELAGCGSGGLAAGIGAHIGIATPPVFKFGTEDQKQRFLVPAIRGDRIAALGITEPGAGSDVAGIRTKAQRVDGGFVVNGSKTFITNGVRADFVVTAVKTTQEGGHQGLSFLIVERGMEGFSVSKKLEKMGWHASDTAELAFQDVFVPDENLLGTEHKGFYLIMANFQWERLLMALGAVGSMHRMLEATVSFALERSAFGREIGPREERSPIGAGGAQPDRRSGEHRTETLTRASTGPRSSSQAIRHRIAEMALKLEAGRAITYHALRLFHAGHDATREVTEAKLATQRAAFEVADSALQIHGGAGYMKEYEIERAARDLRLGPIGGGTDEIMKEILAKQLGL